MLYVNQGPEHLNILAFMKNSSQVDLPSKITWIHCKLLESMCYNRMVQVPTRLTWKIVIWEVGHYPAGFCQNKNYFAKFWLKNTFSSKSSKHHESWSHKFIFDHNLDLTPFHTSLYNNALATIFQVSRAGFFPHKCKSPLQYEENGVKW